MVLSLLLVLVVEPQKKIETLRFSSFPCPETRILWNPVIDSVNHSFFFGGWAVSAGGATPLEDDSVYLPPRNFNLDNFWAQRRPSE